MLGKPHNLGAHLYCFLQCCSDCLPVSSSGGCRLSTRHHPARTVTIPWTQQSTHTQQAVRRIHAMTPTIWGCQAIVLGFTQAAAMAMRLGGNAGCGYTKVHQCDRQQLNPVFVPKTGEEPATQAAAAAAGTIVMHGLYANGCVQNTPLYTVQFQIPVALYPL